MTRKDDGKPRMPPLRLSLTGPVRLQSAGGGDLTPRSMKARGALAVLGVARGMRVARARLQDLMWSDRGPEQGAASLRQCLREIRQALGPGRQALCAGPGWIGLDPKWIAVDAAPAAGPEAEFASDLDIRDPEFEDWLRDTRAHFEALRGVARGMADPDGAALVPLPVPVLDLSAAGRAGGTGLASHQTSTRTPTGAEARGDIRLPEGARPRSRAFDSRGPGRLQADGALSGAGVAWGPAPAGAVRGGPSAEDRRVTELDDMAPEEVERIGLPILVLADPVAPDPAVRVMAAMLLHEGAAAALNLLPLRLVEAAGAFEEGALPRAGALRLGAMAHAEGAELAILVTLRDGGTGRVLFSRQVRIDPARPSAALRQGAGQIVVGILRAIDAGGADLAARLPVRDVFAFSRDRLLAADAALARFEDLAEPAVIWAMQAFLRNTLLLERLSTDPAGTIEAAHGFSARALERAPDNPVVLAVAALIASRRRERGFAHELGRAAVAADPANGLARLALSQALTDIGRHAEADREAALARDGALAVLGPATWLMRKAVTSLRAGRLPEAEEHAAAAHGFSAGYRPPLRFLAALRYHRGDEAGAAEALGRLRAVEPDFSLRLMASPDYPVATLKELGLLSITRARTLLRAF